jgi:hypothetical protein
VRLGLRKELDTIADQGEREERVRQATAADTRGLIAATLTAATSAEPQRSRRRFVDIW